MADRILALPNNEPDYELRIRISRRPHPDDPNLVRLVTGVSGYWVWPTGEMAEMPDLGHAMVANRRAEAHLVSLVGFQGPAVIPAQPNGEKAP